jgi:hypothetical protein
VLTPHLRLEAGAGRLRPDLAAHVPTGPLTLVAVVRLAVEAFSVRTIRRDRDATPLRCDRMLSESAGA